MSILDAQICLHALKTWARERVKNRLEISVVVNGELLKFTPYGGGSSFWYKLGYLGETDEQRTTEALKAIDEADAVVVPSGKVPM